MSYRTLSFPGIILLLRIVVNICLWSLLWTGRIWTLRKYVILDTQGKSDNEFKWMVTRKGACIDFCYFLYFFSIFQLSIFYFPVFLYMYNSLLQCLVRKCHSKPAAEFSHPPELPTYPFILEHASLVLLIWFA